MPSKPRLLIRPPQPEDRPGWEALWVGYHAHGPFGGPPPESEITETTWKRLLDPADPVKALVAEQDGRLVGMIQMVFHPVTSLLDPVCFLNDLFVAEAARGEGVGRALVEALYDAAEEHGARRVYWHMQVDNAVARRLYDRVGRQSGHTVYRKTL